MDYLQIETEPIAQVICGGKGLESGLYENKIICKNPSISDTLVGFHYIYFTKVLWPKIDIM